MKNFFLTSIFSFGVLTAPTTALAVEFDINDLLKQAGNAVSNGTVTDMLQGVFSKSNLDIVDLTGIWQATGSAVCFKSENFLKKAGGAAAATALEQKLNPYFSQYGLTGAEFTVNTDGTFSLKIKKNSLSGTIEKSSNGMFIFNFKAFGKVNIGAIPAYVQKTTSSMNVMFDASKLKQLISTIASISGLQLAKTADNLLSQYDGLCVGFKMNKTGNIEGEKNSSTEINSLLDKLKGTASGK